MLSLKNQWKLVQYVPLMEKYFSCPQKTQIGDSRALCHIANNDPDLYDNHKLRVGTGWFKQYVSHKDGQAAFEGMPSQWQ